jgi:glycosyltransferase involved in cell wall biosynthesis
MLDHKHNGYLAKPYNCQDLANGLEFILNHPNPTFLAQNARDKVLNYFSEKIVVPQYIDLYQKMLLCEPNYG